MDDDGFTAFVIARQRALQRTAWLLTGDWVAAEDLVSLSLGRVWRYWARIQRRDDPYVYACRVLLNTYLSSRRRTWRREVPYAEIPEAGSYEPTADLDTRRAVLDVLRDLPRRQRQVIVLRYLADMSELQTAEVMGVAVGTVKSATAAALTALRANAHLRPILAAANRRPADE